MRASRVAIGTVQDRVLRLEDRTPRRARDLPAGSFGRINRRRQRVEPSAVVRAVADRGDDEQVARARRRHIREAFRFGTVACRFFGVMEQQIARRPAAQLERAEIVRGIEPAPRLRASELARQVGQDDDRELEPFRLVHGHDANAVAPLFENRRLGRPRAVRSDPQFIHEASERHAAGRLVLARQLGHVEDVGQRLLAARSQHESDMGTRRFEQPLDGLVDGDMIAPAVKLPQDVQRRRDGREVGRHIRRHAERAERTESIGARIAASSRAVLRRRCAKNGATQRREDRQLVVGPLDGRERRADGLDFLALVKGRARRRARANAARFERVT